MTSLPSLLSRKRAAHAAGISLEHLNRLWNRGRFPAPVALRDGEPLWRAEDVRAFQETMKPTK